MDRHIGGTHHTDGVTPDDMHPDDVMPMTRLEVSSAMALVQFILPTILSAPYQTLLATFENADALRTLVDDKEFDWPATFVRIRRNHAIVLVLAHAQQELKEILLGYEKHTTRYTNARSTEPTADTDRAAGSRIQARDSGAAPGA